MVKHDPDAQWLIPKTKPVSDETKEADSGSNPERRAEAILVAIADFGLFVENPTVMAIGAATRMTKPATIDQTIILLCFVM